uniref:Uncharacterized protein n=1 Tax=Arundo donax TaxID=35708 RepID=A0A0A9AUV7_ARUDO
MKHVLNIYDHKPKAEQSGSMRASLDRHELDQISFSY